MSFWFGIVEGRNDPLMLGRCKVRVFGVHSEDKTLVPTEDLPWAMPMQPITSAAMNGIGSTPLGPVEGTWVAVIFRDPEDKQQPVMIGSLGAIPSGRSNIFELDEEQVVIDTETGKIDSGSGVVTGKGQLSVSGNVMTNNGNIVDRIPQTITQTTSSSIGPLTSSDISTLQATLRKRESSNNYSAVNQYGFIGAYQFGALMLIDLGYVVPSYRKNSKLVESSAWTGLDSITSRESFLSNTSVQDKAIVNEFILNWKRLKRLGVVNENTTKKEAAGLLCSCHLVGAGGAADLVKGIVKLDGNGVSSKSYYDLGYSCIEGDLPVSAPSTDIAAESRSKSETAESKTTNKQIETINKTRFGFKDPNGKYPKQDFLKEPDTSRLARGQNVKKTIVAEKEIARQTGIPKANGTGSFDQPVVPYNAKYPFNHVTETESGHIIELDDSPGSERIHLYHAAGTFTEIDANGTQVNRIVGDSFQIIERDGNVHISGNCNITVDGSASIYVQNHADIQVDGNTNFTCYNDVNGKVAGNVNLDVHGTVNAKVNGDIDLVSNANIKAKCNTFDIESKNFNVRSDYIRLTTNEDIHFRIVKDYYIDIMRNSYSQQNLSEYAEQTGLTYNLPNMPRDVFQIISLPPLNHIITHKESSETKFELAEDGGTNFNNLGLENGDLTVDTIKVPTIVSTDTSSQVKVNPKTISSTLLNSNTYGMDLQLTTNFKLGQLVLCSKSTGPNPIIRQNGVEPRDIVYNLQQLAFNVLEPIYAKYPDMTINSGLRKVENGSSQHEIGQAIDIRFNIDNKDYYNRIIELKNLIPFDQLILEYQSTNTGIPWIHISYNPTSLRGNIFTYYNHNLISNKFVQLIS